MFEKITKPFLGIPEALQAVFPGFLAIAFAFLILKIFPLIPPILVLAFILFIGEFIMDAGLLAGIVAVIGLHGLGFLPWFFWFLILALVAWLKGICCPEK